MKQLITEKVENTLKEESQLREDEVLTVYRATKDKVLHFIQKDNNAGVRDAAVALLTTFKVLLS